MQNPYASRWTTFADGSDKHEDRMIRYEAAEAEAMDTQDCNQKDGCDGTCYYRPGVGGWWCGKCGELMRR